MKKNKNKILVLVMGYGLVSSVFAQVAIDSGGINLNDGMLTAGTNATVGATYTFEDVATTVNGTAVDAVAVITALNNVTEVTRTPLDSSNGNALFAITGDPDADLQVEVTFFEAGTTTEISLTGLGFEFTDIDSSLNNTYSEFAGVLSSEIDGIVTSSGSQLVTSTTTVSGYTVSQLGDFSDGNSGSDADSLLGSTNPDDYTAGFDLADGSSFDLIFGVVGDANATSATNRGGSFAFTTEIVAVPEPSSSLLLSLSSLALLLKRRR